MDRELVELYPQSDELDRLKASVIKKLSPLLLSGGNNLIQIIDNIGDCQSRFDVIRQLYLCYVQFNTSSRKAVELKKKVSVPNTIRHILKENFGVTDNLDESNATTRALFNLLQQSHNEKQQEQQKNVSKNQVENPLKLRIQKFSTTNADLYSADVKSTKYDSGVEKMQTSKGPLALHLAHLLVGSFALAQHRIVAYESIDMSTRGVTREMHKQDPTHVLVIANPKNLDNDIEPSRQAYSSADRNLALAQYPIYQVLVDTPDQSIKTNVLFLSEQQAEFFIKAAKTNPDALLKDGKWDLSKIHPDPIESSLEILEELIKERPGVAKPYQEIALHSIQQLIERTHQHNDPETFTKDLASTVSQLQEFLTINKISCRPFLSALKTAEEKCTERFEVLAEAKAKGPSPMRNIDSD